MGGVKGREREREKERERERERERRHTCLLEILKAGASSERLKSTSPAVEFRPRVTDSDVIMNSTTFPFRMVYTPGPNSAGII